MSRQQADEILDKIESEKGEIPFSIRLTKTEREQLGKIARNYKRPMGDVMRLLLHQAVIDYAVDGEVFALAK